jgi:hemoglobin-like flavoprotein
MNDLTPRIRFLHSLDRCTQSGEFIHAFYARFMATSEEVRLKFRNTHFERQHKMLLISLRLIAEATNGDAKALREIRERSDSHARDRLNIPPHLYEHWKFSLIETAREHDHFWNDDVLIAWNEILGHAIACMTKRY